MTEPTAPNDTTGAAPEAPPAPPWGDDFDPARAWEKIQKANAEAKNLRSRVTELSAKPVLTDEQQAQLGEYGRLLEASKSEDQRRAEAVEVANRERDESRSETLRLRLALKHGIGEDDFDLLGSGTEEQIEARAQRIAEKNKAATAATLAQEATQQQPTIPPASRTVEDLRPGASPAQPGQVVETDYPSSWLTPRQRERLNRRSQERSTT